MPLHKAIRINVKKLLPNYDNFDLPQIRRNMTKKILIFINHLKMGGGTSKSAAFLGLKLHNKSYDVYYLSISHYLPMYEVKGQYFALNQDFESFSKTKKFKFLIFDIPKIIKDFSNKHIILNK